MRAQEIAAVLLDSEKPVNVAALIEASVHLPRRGSRWVASFRDETGRQVWRSTGLNDRESALALAGKWETEARRTRVGQPAPARKPTIRVRPGSVERELGLLTQAEVGLILGIFERAVREIERRAFDKIRRHPALRGFWREWNRSEIKEAGLVASTEWALSPSEVVAVYDLAQTPAEREALRKLLALTRGVTGPSVVGWSR